jgi:hypothetical protein
VCPARELPDGVLVDQCGLLFPVERSAIGEERQIAVVRSGVCPSLIGTVEVGASLAPLHVAFDVGVDEPIAPASTHCSGR